MPIRFEINDEQITRPAVAKALADLMLGLGGASRPRAAAAEHGVSDLGPGATRKRKAARKKWRPSWEEFHASLSDNTRTFIALLAERRQLPIRQAQEALGLDSAKAVGGIVSALGRKAANAGIELPFAAGHTRAGTRAWFWRPKVAAKLGIKTEPEG